MKKCFLFDYYKEVSVVGRGIQKQNFLVVFFAYPDVSESKPDIQLQLRNYFFTHTLPDKLIIVCFDYNKNEVIDLFKLGSSIYQFIPRFEYDSGLNNLVILSLGAKGNYSSLMGYASTASEVREVFQRGLTKIFADNGGLIISKSAHHFVFPSGKHCDRFLRTGNVLLHGSHIIFLAAALHYHFKEKDFKHIYCDTSSINSLAYAYINLRRQLKCGSSEFVHVESFGSYQLFEDNFFTAKRGSVFLISSSTSGSILARMTDKRNLSKNISLNDIAVLYGLGVESQYQSNLICDLTKNQQTNPKGLDRFISYNVKSGQVCKHCQDNSKPITVSGDVFLLEKPAVNVHLVGVRDLPPFMRNFGGYYRKSKDNPAVIRAFYKENGKNDRKYEIYIDVEALADLWLEQNEIGPNHFFEVFSRFEKYVLRAFPASLKYIISLQDTASLKLANVIVKILSKHGFAIDESSIIGVTELHKIVKENRGTIAVVSSSVVTGRNLLFLSRALRDFEINYQRMYFNFINRAHDEESFDFLESNLGLGEHGKETHKIFNVEKILCSLQSSGTPWHEELEFMKKLEDFCEDQEEEDFQETLRVCKERQQILNESGRARGIDDKLFLPTFRGGELKINHGFAFSPVKEFTSTSSQSEVYFIISNILKGLRNKGTLVQSEYVKNILAPGNFVRYNDGIIQACLLRAATIDELKYHLSDERSLEIKAVIGDMVVHLNDDHSDAIVEFFYSIALKKLRIPDNDLKDCIALLKDQKEYQEKDSFLKGLIAYIESTYFDKLTIADRFKNLAIPEVPEDVA